MHELGLRNTEVHVTNGFTEPGGSAPEPESQGIRLQFPTCPSFPKESFLYSGCFLFFCLFPFFPGYFILPKSNCLCLQEPRGQAPILRMVSPTFKERMLRKVLFCKVGPSLGFPACQEVVCFQIQHVYLRGCSGLHVSWHRGTLPRRNANGTELGKSTS